MHRFSCRQVAKLGFRIYVTCQSEFVFLWETAVVWIWVHVRNTGLFILVTHWTSNTNWFSFHGLSWDVLQTSTRYCGRWHFCWDESSCIDKQKKHAIVPQMPTCCASQTNNFLGRVPSPPLSSVSSSLCVFCLFSCWLELHLLLIAFSHISELLRCL